MDQQTCSPSEDQNQKRLFCSAVTRVEETLYTAIDIAECHCHSNSDVKLHCCDPHSEGHVE